MECMDGQYTLPTPPTLHQQSTQALGAVQHRSEKCQDSSYTPEFSQVLWKITKCHPETTNRKFTRFHIWGPVENFPMRIFSVWNIFYKNHYFGRYLHLVDMMTRIITICHPDGLRKQIHEISHIRTSRFTLAWKHIQR